MNADKRERTLLIVGCGVLGGDVLDLLCWSGFDGHVVVAGRNEKALHERVNLSLLAAYNQGRHPSVEKLRLDLDDLDRTAETLADLRPHIILNATSVQTYWRISALPATTYQRLAQAGIGPWLAMHLSPAYRLMTAVHRAGLSSIVVNAAYPDAVNAVLRTRGLQPTAGIGNVMNVVPAIRAAAALSLGVGISRLNIRLVAHHYVSNRLPAEGDTGGAPFDLRVYVDGADVTPDLDVPKVFRLLPGALRRTRGKAGMYVTASSAYTVLRKLTSPTESPAHVPGPAGLVGGYPVLVSTAGVRLNLADGCSTERAVAINEAGQAYDGIERITADGRVILTDLAVETMRSVLGHDCREIGLDDCHAWADELHQKYLDFEARCGAPAVFS